jgi:hypothetical protein
MIADRQIAFGKAAGKGLSAKSYIQDGLVAMWDGIENAGWGVHDPSAINIFDISGNGHILEFSGAHEINADSFYIDGTNGAYAYVSDLSFGSPVSMEMCIEMYAKDQYGRFIGEGRGLCAYGGTANSRIGYLYGFGKDGAFDTYIDPGFGVVFSQTLTVETSLASLFFNGEFASSMACENSQYSGISYIFGRVSPGRGISGKVYNFRLYSRALTAEEIVHNHNIDRQRFAYERDILHT